MTPGPTTGCSSSFTPGSRDDDERVTLIGPEKLSEMVVEAGLVGWLIRKVS
jgi:hypothetical protein